MTNDPGKDSTACSKCKGTHSPADACEISGGTRVGAVLDHKYEIVRLLAQGGMGEVYEARHTKIGRRVAVKFLHVHYAKHPGLARRFENEAKAAGGIEHENIAAVYDVGALPDGTQYLVMDFLDGEDLEAILSREGTLSLSRAADLVMQACQGLDAVHRRGIVHRDLKPANLFVTKRADKAELVKVLDFGIAKLRHPEGGVQETHGGTALGTAYYMSPEQVRADRDIGPASDVYALGVIFYELVSGMRPHDGDSLLQILHRILTQPPTPLEQVCPGLPSRAYDIVGKAMAHNPADRFRSATEFAQALGVLARGTPVPSQPLSLEETRSETVAALVAVPAHVGAREVRVAEVAPTALGMTRSAATLENKRGTLLLGVLVAMIAVVALVTIRGSGGRMPATPPLAVASLSPTAAPVPPAARTAPSASAAEVSAPQPVSGRSTVSGHSAPVVAPRKNAGQGVGAPLASAPAGSASSMPPLRVECPQTYFIDLEGNKHFRPECFLPK
jgi:serine/threonine-protein kinase